MSRVAVLLSLSLVGCAATVPDELPEGRDFTASARTLRPGCAGSPYGTIQAAISAAANGDVLRICAGTYNERLVVVGKRLRIQSDSGAMDVTVDAQTFGAGLTVSGQADVTVDGIQFVNGNTADGGGNVACRTSALSISNSRLADGFSGKGGGLGANGCTGTVRTTTFEGNEAWRGGGAWVNAGGMNFDGNTFLRNEADGSSGGALYSEGTIDFLNNTLDQNRATLNAGGAYVGLSFGRVAGNLVQRSRSGDDGGGIMVQFGEPVVEDNTFVDNLSEDEAGGLRVKECVAVVRNNHFEGNEAWDAGGGMKISHEGMEVSGNTFVGNSAPDGGALYLFESASTLTDCVFEDNVATFGDGGAISIVDGWDPVTIEDSTFVGNEASSEGGHVHIDLAGPRVTFRRVTMTDGVAARGGGIYALESDVVIENTVLRGNRATQTGGAVYVERTTGRLTNAVVYGNSAPTGSGLRSVRGAAFDVSNTIFAAQVGAGAAIGLNGGTAPTVRYSDFFQNPANFQGMADLSAQNNNVVSNPRFTAAASDDFTLLPNSTLIDRGDPAVLDANDSRSDMGRWGGPEAF